MSEEQVARNKLVVFTYQIADEAGEILERIDMPVQYVHGSRTGLLEKVEQALEGHRAGDVVRVELSPEDGFGPHDENLTYTDDIANVPEEFRHLGAEVEMQGDGGETRVFRVSSIKDGKLTVDANHPLAGKALTFTLTISQVRNATPEEIAESNDTIRPVLH